MRGSSTAPAGRQWIDIHNVDLGVTDRVTIRVRTLHGEVLRTLPAQSAVLDDPLSFKIRVTSATVGLTGTDLGAILNTVVFAYPGAPLRDLQVRTDGDQIIETGILHKGVDLRFRLHGNFHSCPTGAYASTPRRCASGHQRRKDAQHDRPAPRQHPRLKGAKGAAVKGDVSFSTPRSFLPPPEMDGDSALIALKAPKLVQDFVRSPDDSVFGRYVKSDTAGHNFIHFRGGELRFGKLLMSDTIFLRIWAPLRNRRSA